MGEEPLITIDSINSGAYTADMMTIHAEAVAATRAMRVHESYARLVRAAQAIIEYTESGAPDFPDWEAKYVALSDALDAL